MNIWAIRRDPNVWKNPWDFTSERFQSGKMQKLIQEEMILN